MKVAIFGLGYVGCVNAICTASMGHEVYGVEPKAAKLESLDKGELHIFEPGLKDKFAESVQPEKRFHWVQSHTKLPEDIETYIIAVGTPPMENGEVNLNYVKTVVEEIAQCINKQDITPTVLLRSTVPPGTSESSIIPLLKKHCKKPFEYAFYPEFLREGNAIDDFYSPSLNILGTSNSLLATKLSELLPKSKPIEVVDINIAEMIKYVNNSYHAVKVTFANEIGRTCKALGVNSQKVMDLFKSDTDLNISGKYFNPGAPFGGTCLTKELHALNYFFENHNLQAPMLSSVLDSNDQHIDSIVSHAESHNCACWGVYGVCFKPNTDDTRESPVIKIMEKLSCQSFSICEENSVFVSTKQFVSSDISNYAIFDEVLENSDGIILGSMPLTESDVAKLRRFAGPIIDLQFFSTHSDFKEKNNYQTFC